MIDYFHTLTFLEIIFLTIGFTGQGLFASRFIIQWIYSEKKGESSIPIVFWYVCFFWFFVPGDLRTRALKDMG